MLQRSPKSGCTPGCTNLPENAPEGPAHRVSESGPTDPDLARMAAVWPRLPEAVRAEIVAMVKVAEKGGTPMKGKMSQQ